MTLNLISIIRNMSLARKTSKNTLRTNVEDFAAAMDQKNNIIYTLQNELQTLRPNQDKYDRVKQELIKTKGKHESLIRDYERIVSNNVERLELSARNVQQLRIQSDHLVQELRLRGQALKQARFTTQQLIELQNKKEDESTECRINFQELKSNAQVLKIEEQRIRLQIYQLREEVEKGKKETSLIKTQNQQVNEKCYKTQSYIRGLVREQANLNQNLSKLQDDNHKLDSAISQLSTLVAVNQSTLSQKEKDKQQLCFNISSKGLEKKKIENQIKEKIKQINAEKEKSKLLCQQLEQKKNEANRLEAQMQEACADINFIFTKNHQIEEVNQQLNEDLNVCQKHRENVLRSNKILESQIQGFKNHSLKIISKLQQPLKNRSNYMFSSDIKGKWDCGSRISDYETGDFEKRSYRN